GKFCIPLHDHSAGAAFCILYDGPMKTEDRQKGPASAQETASRGSAEEAPVVSLDHIRQRRRQRAEEETRQRAGRMEKLFTLEQDLHRRILQHALSTRRLLFSDFVDLIKLGIITDDPEHLPCEVHTRQGSYDEWESAYFGEDTDDPDEDLL